MTEFEISLSTALSPAKKFQLDGDPYDLLGIDHLSPNDEARVMALFARLGVLTAELELTSNVNRGEELAKRVKETRLNILAKLTSAPKDSLEKLPLGEQVRLLGAIEGVIGTADADEDDDTGNGSTSDDES